MRRTAGEKIALYDTRQNGPRGIYWRGWWYEVCLPLVSTKKTRIMVVEDHEDYLIASDYSFTGWHDPCRPVGERYRVNRIGVGKPTKERLKMLQDAVKELQA